MIKLYDLQIVNGQNYLEQSEKRLVREVQLQAPRGEIYDRYGKLLVTNEIGYDLGIYGIDGSYGKDTEAAVRKYQRDNNGIATKVTTETATAIPKEEKINKGTFKGRHRYYDENI